MALRWTRSSQTQPWSTRNTTKLKYLRRDRQPADSSKRTNFRNARKCKRDNDDQAVEEKGKKLTQPAQRVDRAVPAVHAHLVARTRAGSAVQSGVCGQARPLVRDERKLPEIGQVFRAVPTAE